MIALQIVAIVLPNLIGIGVCGWMQVRTFGKWKNALIGYLVCCSLLSLTIQAFPPMERQTYSPDIIAVDPVTAADIKNLRAARDEVRDRVRDRIEAYHAGL